MPRYDDRNSSTRLFVGRLSSRTRSRDLEDLFCRYGRVRNVDMKQDFAFVEFSDPRDADDARYSLNGRDVDGSRITVEFAKGAPRAPGGSREYLGKGPPPGSGRCFNCGLDGHWARDCKSGDWKNKCYRCGDRGHIERSCKNSPKKLRRESSYSQSPSPRRGRSRSPGHSRGRNYSRSKSPLKRERSADRVERRSRSPKRSRQTSPAQSKSRRHRSPSEERISRKRVSISPKDRRKNNGSDYSRSPRARSRSPKVYSVSPGAKSRSPKVDSVSPGAKSRSPKVDSVSPITRSRSPKVDTEADGAIKSTNEENFESRSPSPSPSPSRRTGSPVEDDHGSPIGRESG